MNARMSDTMLVDGVPLPEMAAGAIMGGLATLAFTYVPQLAPLFDPRGTTLWIIVGLGAVIGAVVSFFLAREHAVALEQGERAEREIRRAA